MVQKRKLLRKEWIATVSENASTWATEASASLLYMKQDAGNYPFQGGWQGSKVKNSLHEKRLGR